LWSERGRSRNRGRFDKELAGSIQNALGSIGFVLDCDRSGRSLAVGEPRSRRVSSAGDRGESDSAQADPQEQPEKAIL